MHANTKNHKSIFLLFWICLLFQLTVIKYMLDVPLLARCVNSFMFAYLFYLITFKVSTHKYYPQLMLKYFLPGALIVFGMLLNISLNFKRTGNFSVLSYLGLVIPWLTYLIVPYWMKRCEYPLEKLWRSFYLFMLCSTVLALIDWFLTFHGINYLRGIKTPGGNFIAGLFSIYYQLNDGGLHRRMYGIFAEPGTYAMWLIPAIAYAHNYKKYYGLIPLILALLLTRSLGGYLSLISLIILTTVMLRGKNNFKAVCIYFLITCILALGMWTYLSNQYEAKGKSRTVRISNVIDGIELLPNMIVTKPMGFDLETRTSQMKKNNNDYVGGNFTLINYFMYGGVLAFLGYLLVITRCVLLFIIIIFRRVELKRIDLIVWSSIIPLLIFMVQRTTFLEGALFAFLFSPSILNMLTRHKRKFKSISMPT